MNNIDSNNSDADEEAKKRIAHYDKLISDAQALVDRLWKQEDQRQAGKIAAVASGLANIFSK